MDFRRISTNADPPPLEDVRPILMDCGGALLGGAGGSSKVLRELEEMTVISQRNKEWTELNVTLPDLHCRVHDFAILVVLLWLAAHHRRSICCCGSHLAVVGCRVYSSSQEQQRLREVGWKFVTVWG